VAGARVVTPQDVEAMNPVAGKSVVSLQTCTFPDFSNRLIVQGELVS
jgi:sortase A